MKTLRKGEITKISQGCSLRVVQGRVWLTWAGELEDKVLGPGHGLNLSDKKDVVIEALDTKSVVLISQ